jgi:hypothetical protein
MAQAPMKPRDYDPEDPPRFGEWVRVQGAAPRRAAPRVTPRSLPIIAAVALVAVAAGMLATTVGKRIGGRPPGTPPKNRSTDQTWRRCVVTVKVGSKAESLVGTGFCVGDPSLIVTSQSLFPGQSLKRGGPITIVVRQGGGSQEQVPGRLVSPDPESVNPLDRPVHLALVRLVSSDLKPLPLNGSLSGGPGKEWRVVGAAGKPVAVSVDQGKPDHWKQGLPVTLHGSLRTQHVGAPVVDASGRVAAIVVAINSAADTEGASGGGIRAATAILSSDITRFVKQAKERLTGPASGMPTKGRMKRFKGFGEWNS